MVATPQYLKIETIYQNDMCLRRELSLGRLFGCFISIVEWFQIQRFNP